MAGSTLTNPTLTASVHDNDNPAGSSAVDDTGAGPSGELRETINQTQISPLERRNSLEKHLQTRPDAQDLRNRHILVGSEGQSPAIQAKARELERARATDNLKKELGSRPEKDDLIARNILPEGNAAPGIQAQQKELQKHMRMDSLEQKLAQRPTAEDLEKRGVLGSGESAIEE